MMASKHRQVSFQLFTYKISEEKLQYERINKFMSHLSSSLSICYYNTELFRKLDFIHTYKI